MSAKDFTKAPREESEQLQTFLTRLRAQRRARGWTQAELAAQAGMSRATYENLERGQANLSMDKLLRLLCVLGHGSRFPDLLPEPDIAGGHKAGIRRKATSAQRPAAASRFNPVEVRCLLD